MSTHGIILRTKKNKTVVSCQCNASDMKHSRSKGGGEYYEPMSEVSGEDVWQTYNRPENHTVEFTSLDRIRT